jgi:hypothetical protein
MADNLFVPTQTAQGSNDLDLLAVRLRDENSAAFGVKHIGNKMRTSSVPYLYDIAEGNVPDHEVLRVIGYNEDVDAAIEMLWHAGGAYVFPTGEMGMEVVSSEAQDAAVVIRTGETSDSITQVDSVDNIVTITLTDASEDFTAATTVVAGDGLILDGDNINGNILTVAETVLTARVYNTEEITSVQDYRVVDASASGTGARIVSIHYLDSDYAEHEEMVVLNGTTPVATTATDIFRVNAFHTEGAGSTQYTAGDVTLRHLSDTPIYASIPALRNNRADCIYTVPTGKTAYITGWKVSSGFSTANRLVRSWLEATSDEHANYTGLRWHTKDADLTQDGRAPNSFLVPIKIPARASMRIIVSCPETNAVVVGDIEGWLE